jgi:hypothetical protein
MSLSRLLVIVLLATLAAPAQEYRATLSGRIVDTQGLAVPAAKIQLRQIDTGATYQTVSENSGQYVLPLLPPGDYQMTAEAQGFKSYTRTRFRISTGERVAIDIAMEVGTVQESITVTSEVPLLQTATANTGQVLTTTQIENMPMNGRTPLVLAQLANGVVPPSLAGFSRPFDNQGPSEFSMSGAPSRSNEILLDGAPNNTKDNRVAYNPPVDAVQEMKIDTFQSDAAFGNTVGGVVNMVMKSGTNSLHGSAYWFNQVAVLNATPFFTNAASQPKPPMRFNQYGITAGGPVVMPKVVDGHDKLFFYVAYEGIKDYFPRPATISVPAENWRRGDFSNLLGVGNQYQIYNPFSGVREGSRVRRLPFAGNIIPASLLNPVAVNAQKLYPTPNLTGRNDGLLNYMSNITGEKNSYFNYLLRGDWNVGTRQKLAANYRHNVRESVGPNELGCFPHELCGNAGGRTRVNTGAGTDHVLTISPSLLLNTRVNFTRFTQGRLNHSEGYDLVSLGFPKALNDSVLVRQFPRFEFNNFFRLGDGGSNSNPQDIFQVFSTLNRVRGNHSLKVGTDLRLYRDNLNIYDWPVGRFFFRTEWTRGPLDNSSASPHGQDYAAFLLGLPTSGQIDWNAGRSGQSGYYSFFVQDDWRVSPSLTLNLGLRYEADMPATERFNRTVNGFAFDATHPLDAGARAAYAAKPIPEIAAADFRVRGGLTFAADSNRSVYETQKKNFSPRIGFAWKPDLLGAKSVIRGGFGIFYDSLGSVPGIVQSGFAAATPYVSTLDNYLTPETTLSNPFPGGISQPTGSGAGLNTFVGQAISFYTRKPQNPYSVKWNFNIQRELSRNLVMEVGYAGNRSVHLAVDQQANYIPRQYLSATGERNQAVINSLTGSVSNPFAGLVPGTSLNGSSIARHQLLRPYPQFLTNVNHQGLPDGSAYFHALQVRLEKRLSSGLTFLGNYQFSKLIDRLTRLNDFDAPEKHISSTDRPHRLVVSASYELPWLKGKAAGGAARAARFAAGGWILNGIYVYQSGGSLAWGNVIYLGGDLNYDPRRIAAAFDTTTFNRDSTKQLDYNVRSFPARFSSLRTDVIDNFDLSLLKNFPIVERVNAQIRIESFNAMNRTQFGNPNVTPTASAFAQITGQANQPRRMQMALRLTW